MVSMCHKCFLMNGYSDISKILVKTPFSSVVVCLGIFNKQLDKQAHCMWFLFLCVLGPYVLHPLASCRKTTYTVISKIASQW